MDRRGAGFTLIELLIVVAILGLLAVVAIPRFMEYNSKARDASAFSDAKSAIQVLVAAHQ